MAQNPTFLKQTEVHLVFPEKFSKSREEVAFGSEPYVPQTNRSSFSFSRKIFKKSGRGDSNARPLRPERSALPTALLPVILLVFFQIRLQSYKKILS